MKAVEGFVKENRSALSQQHQGAQQGVQGAGQAAGRARRDRSRSRPTALANLFHTYNPATGTLDTRTNVGENISKLTADPVGARLRHPHGRPNGNAGKACCDAARAGAARARRRSAAAGARQRRRPRQVETRRPVARRDPGGAAMSTRGRAEPDRPRRRTARLRGAWWSWRPGPDRLRLLGLQPAAARRRRPRATTRTRSRSSSATSSTWCRSRRSRSTTSPSARSTTSRSTATTPR